MGRQVTRLTGHVLKPLFRRVNQTSSSALAEIYEELANTDSGTCGWKEKHIHLLL